MFNVKKLRFSRFFNFALWAEKFTFTQQQKQTMRRLFDIFVRMLSDKFNATSIVFV